MLSGFSRSVVMINVILQQRSWAVKLNYYLSPGILFVIDYLAVCLGIYTSIFFRDVIVGFLGMQSHVLTIKDIHLYFILPIIYIGFIAYADMYRRRMMFYQCIGAMFRISTYVAIIIIFIGYFMNMAEPISRVFMALFWLLSFFYICIERFLTKKILVKFGMWQWPVIIVGAGKTAEILAAAFEKDKSVGYKIVGFIEDEKDRPLLMKYKHLGEFDRAEDIIKAAEVQDVILATPGLKREELVQLFYRIQPYVRHLSIVPDVFGVPIGNIKTEVLFNEQALLINTCNNLNRKSNQVLKRMFDLAIGSMVFIGILPILILIMIVIKLDSQGSAFHIAQRIGKNGKLFYCYKFRTMYENSDAILEKFFQENPQYQEEWEKFAKLRTIDPRVTRVGKCLRRYSLDELPQIMNVLFGSMGLVGPRPYLPREKEKIGHYMHVICMTVPGITGLWQVSGRSEITFEGRLKLDSWYVRNWSLWQDVVLLFKTVSVVFAKKGAY